MPETLAVRIEENEEYGRKSYRAAIRFAPGPYGEVFTDWYIAKKGAELAADQFRAFLARSAAAAKK